MILPHPTPHVSKSSWNENDFAELDFVLFFFLVEIFFRPISKAGLLTVWFMAFIVCVCVHVCEVRTQWHSWVGGVDCLC